jgi:hypothetical protein
MGARTGLAQTCQEILTPCCLLTLQSYALKALISIVPECTDMESNDGRRPVDMAKYGECREVLKGIEAQRKHEHDLQASRERVLQHLGMYVREQARICMHRHAPARLASMHASFCTLTGGP